jgi:hypothetical protein
MEAALALVPDRDRPTAISALVVYTFLVFGTAKSSAALALGMGLPLFGYEIPGRPLGGATAILFVLALAATLLVFRKVAAGGSRSGRSLFARWLLQGAWQFILIGTIASVLERLFLSAVLPTLRPHFDPAVRGAIGATFTGVLYGIAVLIAYRWAKRRIDAR